MSDNEPINPYVNDPRNALVKDIVRKQENGRIASVESMRVKNNSVKEISVEQALSNAEGVKKRPTLTEVEASKLRGSQMGNPEDLVAGEKRATFDLNIDKK